MNTAVIVKGYTEEIIAKLKKDFENADWQNIKKRISGAIGNYFLFAEGVWANMSLKQKVKEFENEDRKERIYLEFHDELELEKRREKNDE